MNALVTGGAGFIGAHLVDALLARGDNVRVLDNCRRPSGRLATLQVELIEGDVRDDDSVRRALVGAEVVYHLAAQSNVIGAITDADYSFSTNVVGTYNVLKAAERAGARRLVFASSREVYGEPQEIPVSESASLTAKNAYGASKVAGEAYCRAWSSGCMEVQVLRFANVYGPGDADRVIPIWLERALSGQALELFGGQQLIDFVWVGTAVQALLAAAEFPLTGPVNVASGCGTPLQALATRILDITRSDSQLRVLPAREAEVVRFVADVTRMKELLNVLPDVDTISRLDRCVQGREAVT